MRLENKHIHTQMASNPLEQTVTDYVHQVY